MWLRYLKPRCASGFMHDIEPRGIQQLLDAVALQDGLAPQTMQHVEHFLGGVFTFAIAQGHLARGTVNPVAFCETSRARLRRASLHARRNCPDAYSPTRALPNCCSISRPSQGCGPGEVRGLTWESLLPRKRNRTGDRSCYAQRMARTYGGTKELALEGTGSADPPTRSYP